MKVKYVNKDQPPKYEGNSFETKESSRFVNKYGQITTLSQTNSKNSLTSSDRHLRDETYKCINNYIYENEQTIIETKKHIQKLRKSLNTQWDNYMLEKNLNMRFYWGKNKKKWKIH